MRNRFAVILLPVLLLCTFSSAQQQFQLHDGDRVVFYGDSITEQKLYTNFIESYVRTRFPNLKIEFWNAGVGGDTVRGGWAGSFDERFPRDVLAYKPTVVTIMLGMNDGQYRASDPAVYDNYVAGYKKIVQRMKSELPGVRITALQPSPFDDVTRPPQFPQGYNSVLQHFAQFIQTYAGEQHLMVADLNTPVVNELQKARDWNSEAAKFIIPDRVHPGAAGHWVMALAVLKSWGAPAIVTDVAIDGASAKAIRTENTELTSLVKTASGLSWTQLDRALPLDFNTDDINAALAERFAQIQEQLNQQPLKITNLPAGKYSLKIDAKPVGEFDAQQLASGINLALLDTPMKEQSGTLSWRFISEHNETHMMRLRVLVSGKGSAESTQAAAYLQKQEDDTAREAHEVAMPKSHNFELVRM